MKKANIEFRGILDNASTLARGLDFVKGLVAFERIGVGEAEGEVVIVFEEMDTVDLEYSLDGSTWTPVEFTDVEG